MAWHKDKIERYIKENYYSVIFFFVFMLFCTLWYYFSGQKFEWKNIDWISVPPLWERFLYSYLVYKTLGKWLYDVYFYKFLHFIFVGILNNRRKYKEVKSALWDILMAVMFFYIIPAVVDLLNFIISFVYNTIALILYLAPVMGTCLILYFIYSCVDKRVKDVEFSPRNFNNYLKK